MRQHTINDVCRISGKYKACLRKSVINERSEIRIFSLNRVASSIVMRREVTGVFIVKLTAIIANGQGENIVKKLSQYL